MTIRTASCSCGQLRATCVGAPVRVGICHCLACQQRTGSVYSVQARFAAEQVTIEGRAAHWARTGDSGGAPCTFSFCPVCGSTVCWSPEGPPPRFVLVAVGAFADPGFPPPQISVYEERRHAWALTADDLPLEHHF